MAGTNPFRPKNIDNEAPGAPRQVHAENEGRIPTIDTGQYYCARRLLNANTK
jgi:hypothetical protein